MKKLVTILGGLLGFILLVIPVSAHVIVKPDSVGVAAFQTFSMGVPNEKDTAVTSIRLLIPDGLQMVSPNVKPGWKIDVKKEGSGDSAKVTEIDWSEGSIPPGERDDFLFNAQVSSKETTLNWKAYQTYQGGTVVTWDQDPAAMSKMSDSDQDKMVHDQNKGPYSQTKIINDLTGSSAKKSETNPVQAMTKGEVADNVPLILSSVSALLSIAAIGLALRRK